MKKLILLFLLVPSVAFAIDFRTEYATPSFEFTSATKQVYNKTCYITYIKLDTDGSNDATVILYDTASGAADATRVVDRFTVTSTNNYGGATRTYPIKCERGIYVEQNNSRTKIEYIK